MKSDGNKRGTQQIFSMLYQSFSKKKYIIVPHVAKKVDRLPLQHMAWGLE